MADVSVTRTTGATTSGSGPTVEYETVRYSLDGASAKITRLGTQWTDEVGFDIYDTEAEAAAAAARHLRITAEHMRQLADHLDPPGPPTPTGTPRIV